MYQKPLITILIIVIVVLGGALGYFLMTGKTTVPSSSPASAPTSTISPGPTPVPSPNVEPPQPATSPAGKNTPVPARNGLIAIQLRDASGKLQIFTINPDGTAIKRLTTEGENGRPAWSPDGKKILFSSFRNGIFPNGVSSVWLMDADGSNQKMIAEGHGVDGWSPDGTKIVYALNGQIWTMDADGKNEKQITTSQTFKAGPTWSHDGKQMAFILVKNRVSQTDFQPEIGIMNADGTGERILTSEDRTNVQIRSDGTSRVLETANDANAPSWSPTENKIAFWSGIETKYGQIWTMNADGTGSAQLTEEPNHKNNDDPSWSPDGKKILFSTGRNGRPELWVMDADGENEKRIFYMEAFPFPGRASWQPLP